MPTAPTVPRVARALLDAADALGRVAESLRVAATSRVPDDGTAVPTFLSVAEAGKSLRISRATVNRRIADGTLRSRRVGGRRLIPVAALKEMAGGTEGMTTSCGYRAREAPGGREPARPALHSRRLPQASKRDPQSASGSLLRLGAKAPA